MKIYKYPFAIESKTSISVPSGHVVMHVGLDPAGVPCVWALVEPEAPKIDIAIWVVGTGHDVPEEACRHVGSFVQSAFVWHIFTR
jgi:hypothetical protein